MPFPVAPVIAAGSSLGSSLGGNAMNNAQNKRAFNRQVRYNKEMYDRQRKDSLADWHMQNQYNQEQNSPAAQMARYKEAGLNPNLIYGQQNMMPAAVVKPTETKGVQPRVSDQNLPDVMAAYQGSRQMAENISNTKQQNLLLAAQTQKTIAEAKTAGANASVANKLAQLSLAAAEVGILKTEVEIKSGAEANQRAWIMQPYDIAEKVARFIVLEEQGKTEKERRDLIKNQSQETIKKIEQITENIKSSKAQRILMEYEIELNRMGVQKNDSMFWRLMAKMYDSVKDIIF